LDYHGSRKFTSGDTFQKVTFKEVIGKWNFPRGNKNVSVLVAPSAGKDVLTPDTVYLDAANDSHSALAIYQVLGQQAPNVTPREEPECFTFDAIDGTLRDDLGRPWYPFNPHYDPGTPPSLPASD
jgi:hypothetical protein